MLIHPFLIALLCRHFPHLQGHVIKDCCPDKTVGAIKEVCQSMLAFAVHNNKEYTNTCVKYFAGEHTTVKSSRFLQCPHALPWRWLYLGRQEIKIMIYISIAILYVLITCMKTTVWFQDKACLLDIISLGDFEPSWVLSLIVPLGQFGSSVCCPVLHLVPRINRGLSENEYERREKFINQESLPQRALFVNLPSLTICQRDVIGQRRFGESFFL